MLQFLLVRIEGKTCTNMHQVQCAIISSLLIAIAEHWTCALDGATSTVCINCFACLPSGSCNQLNFSLSMSLRKGVENSPSQKHPFSKKMKEICWYFSLTGPTIFHFSPFLIGKAQYHFLSLTTMQSQYVALSLSPSFFLVTSVSNLQILAESLLYNHNAKVAMDDHKPNTNAWDIVCRSYGCNPWSVRFSLRSRDKPRILVKMWRDETCSPWMTYGNTLGDV